MKPSSQTLRRSADRKADLRCVLRIGQQVNKFRMVNEQTECVISRTPFLGVNFYFFRKSYCDIYRW